MPVLYLVSFVIATYLVYIVGRRPGYISFSKQAMEAPLELKSQNSEFDVYTSGNLTLYKEKNLPYGDLKSSKPHHLRAEDEIGHFTA